MGTKPFKSYEEQVSILQSRGMGIDDPAHAAEVLRTHNYYRLSGYWHSMRQVDPQTHAALDVFKDGATLDLVLARYDFDARLRHAVFANLAPVELAIRSLLGYHLGALDPLIHLDASKLSATASNPSKRNKGATEHDDWVRKYRQALRSSREDFVEHHRSQYDGVLPVWVAVEVMDWGMLSHLYRFTPNPARNRIARECNMSGPQLESWLKSLNILRNYSAHHARLFTRVFDIKPKTIDDPRMKPVESVSHLVFGQLSLIRYLHAVLGTDGGVPDLAGVLESYPYNQLVSFYRLGTPENWRELDLWS